ncbi:MAG TPA: aminoglycoside phosphotransferase family protein [Ornithinibacter sp.]|nr:aminoglycoside phosphotransferase family protein [Ornithinibacter sp.]
MSTTLGSSTVPPTTPPRGGHGEADVIGLLTGPGARNLLVLALGTVGAEVTDHVVHDVQHRPGDGVTVGFRVWLRAFGADREEYVLISSTAGRDVPDDSPGLARLEGPGGRLIAWRHPHDPALPALGTGCDPTSLEAVLPGTGAVAELELVGYRPLRRAVLRAVRSGTTAYVKVLRPAAGRGGAPDVLHRHHLLTAAGVPVPRVLAATPEGLVVLAQADGTPLVEAISADGAHGLELAHLVAVLDALPAQVLDLPRRTAWSDRARDYAHAVVAARPGADGERALAVARAVRRRSREVDLGPVVPTHGDFHEGQLTVRGTADGWRPAGLLDVDTVGPGHRVDDLACLVAHTVALGPAWSGLVGRWERQATGVVDPDALRVRTAGVLLSLAAAAAHEPGATVGTTALLEAAEERLGP